MPDLSSAVKDLTTSMLDQPGSILGGLAQSDESTQKPTSQKRGASESCQYGSQPRLKRRLAPKPTPDNHQEAPCTSDISPIPEVSRALDVLACERSNQPGRAPYVSEPAITEVEVSMTAAGEGLGDHGQHFSPDLLDPFSWTFLATSFPDLSSANSDMRLTEDMNLREVLGPSASKEERPEHSRQQCSRSCSLECALGSHLEKIVFLELAFSRLSRSAKESPPQQIYISPEEFAMLLEGFVELKQSYFDLQKSVQDSNKSCG